MDKLDLEAVIGKHKLEKKSLQAAVQALKKSATKGDKKKKKEVQDEIAKLEKEIEDRHELEMKVVEKPVEASLSNLKVSTVKEDLPEDERMTDISSEESNQRATKAQKRREKKGQRSKQREQEIEEQEVANLDGKRHQETLAISEALLTKGLKLYEIPSDGNCMYLAVDHQLQQTGQPSLGNKQLRQKSAAYMRSHREDFLPFLTSPRSDDIMTDDEFESYCQLMEDTAAWGGQLELRALSHVLKCPIEVIQADASTLTIGEEYSEQKPLIVTFHRHMYGLGAHYNSVSQINGEPSGED